MTTEGFGLYSEPLADKISRIAATIRCPSFEVVLDKAMSFRNRDAHPFVLTSDAGLDPLRAFYQVLDQRLGEGGFATAGKRSFTPHMTVIWDPKIVPAHEVIHPLKWTVREFVLVRSHQGQSRYDIVGSWPLSVEENRSGASQQRGAIGADGREARSDSLTAMNEING